MGSLSPGDLPNPGIKPRSLALQAILYQLSHKGSPRILEWVAYPFSRGSSPPRNWTGVSCTAGGFFTNWAMREAQQKNLKSNIFISVAYLGKRFLSGTVNIKCHNFWKVNWQHLLNLKCCHYVSQQNNTNPYHRNISNNIQDHMSKNSYSSTIFTVKNWKQSVKIH